jgi:hypothetical protein
MKTTKTLSEDSRSLGRDWNLGLHQYDAGVLAVRLRLSVLPVSRETEENDENSQSR